MNAHAHVKEVAKARFNCDGTYLITAGKTDRAIMIWQVVPMQQQGAATASGASTAVALLHA